MASKNALSLKPWISVILMWDSSQGLPDNRCQKSESQPVTVWALPQVSTVTSPQVTAVLIQKAAPAPSKLLLMFRLLHNIGPGVEVTFEFPQQLPRICKTQGASLVGVTIVSWSGGRQLTNLMNRNHKGKNDEGGGGEMAARSRRRC